MSSNPQLPDPPASSVARPGGLEGDPTGPATRRRPTTRAIVAGALVMLAVVALVVVATQREPVQLSLDTPEGTVQAWLQSVVDDQPTMGLLAPTACAAPHPGALRIDGAVRAVVVDSQVTGDRATVALSVTEGAGNGLFDEGWTHDALYELERTDDGWAITWFDWPWNDCWNDPTNRG